MYEYADLYMSMKPKWTRAVVLNLYGGESLFHPDVVKILEEVKKRHLAYRDKWPLTVTCTTNGVVGKNRMTKIVGLVDDFIVSFHAESLKKQKDLIKENLLLIKQQGKKLKCVILMHGNQKHWSDLLDHIEFCKNNDIDYLPKQIDGPINSQYNTQQITWFKGLWADRNQKKSLPKQELLLESKKNIVADGADLNKVGRACCGGRLLCSDSDLKHPVFFMPDNIFTGWSCSVNWFFLYIKQHTKEIFTNKDCRMNFDGTVSALGSLDDTQTIIDSVKNMIEKKSMPVIVCAKDHCWCGLCAPKSEKKEDLLRIMDKHLIENILT